MQESAGLEDFREEKGTAQPWPYLGAQIIKQAAMVERTEDCNKVPEDVARLIYSYLAKQDFFSKFHCSLN